MKLGVVYPYLSTEANVLDSGLHGTFDVWFYGFSILASHFENNVIGGLTSWLLYCQAKHGARKIVVDGQC